MDTGIFARGLQEMSPTDIHAVAAGLEAWHQTAHDEVAAWRMTMTIDQTLRRLAHPFRRYSCTVATPVQEDEVQVGLFDGPVAVVVPSEQYVCENVEKDVALFVAQTPR